MSETATIPAETVLAEATAIVSAYVSNNPVPVGELPGLILAVHASLVAVIGGALPGANKDDALDKPTSAQVRKSITRDALVSFIDGKPYKTLKRHLTTQGLTPDTYRARFGLPADYPMTSPAYSERRSALAKSLGLGLGRSNAATSEGPTEAPPEKPTRSPRKAA